MAKKRKTRIRATRRKAEQQGRLSNRLYLPFDEVPQRVLRVLTYKFNDIETVEVIDDDGEIQYEDRRVTKIVENFSIRESRGKGLRIGIHHGRLARIRGMLPDHLRWEDARADVPMGARLTLRYDWRYNQEDCFRAFCESDGGGLVHGPTAWGKTYFGIRSAIELDQRALVLTARTNWCRNWLKDIYKLTDAKKIEKAHGRPVAGILQPAKVKSEDDLFACFNICTPNAFWSDRGRVIRRMLRHSFGIVIFDEAVMLPARETSAVYTSFAPLWRLGLSADERKKDGTHKLTYDYCGPVVAEGVFTGRQKRVSVRVVNTGEQINQKYVYGAHWFGSLCTQLSKRRNRNDNIVNNVISDVINGYHPLVLVDRRDQCFKLAKMLEEEVIPVKKRDRKKHKGRKRRQLKVAFLVGGDKLQQEKIKSAGEQEYDVFVAMDRAVGMNTDMPGIDSVHDVGPSTNLQVIKQRWGRGLREFLRCGKCGFTSSSPADKCPECGSSKFRDAKKWPVMITVYADEGIPEDGKIGGFLRRSTETKLKFARDNDYDIEGEVHDTSKRDARKRARQQKHSQDQRKGTSRFIKRKGT